LPQPLRVFISYAHADAGLCEKFVKALSQLQRDGLIEGWDDRGIAPGAEWAGVIDDRLKSADIVVLLVSSDFLASKYCNEIELETALKRHETGKTEVVPVILRPCDWETARFGQLQALPKNGKPVVKWETQDDGFLDVVKGLRVVANARAHAPADQTHSPVAAKQRRRWPALTGIAVVVLLAIAAGGFAWTRHQAARKAASYVAQGKALFDQRKWNDSEAAYLRAKKIDPNNAEAYFGLGVLYDLERDPDAAMKMYERAVKLSPSPQYRGNLADAYFKLGQYKRAVDEYAAISQYPLAALESAKINRLSNRLDDAEEESKVAIGWLNDPGIAGSPENKLPWYFTTDKKSIWVETPAEKLCYAQFELSITLYLKANDGEAQKLADAGRQTCGNRLRGIQAELKPELERILNERPELADRSQEYIQKFLSP
jgi:tetratricopeptide (TPR) repeat protein